MNEELDFAGLGSLPGEPTDTLPGSEQKIRIMNEELDFAGPSSLPGEPTDALPGSDQKIRIMAERALRREQLFHPLDGLVKRKARPSLMDLINTFHSETESA
jgi:hypothetical protein